MSLSIKYNSESALIEGSDPVVILGPNGSGKTRYGLQLSDWNNAENIAALRNIALAENVPMQSLAQAEQELSNHKRQRRKHPWNISSEINNLFAKLMAEDSSAAVDFRDNYQDGSVPAITKLMRLQQSWQALFPGRHIEFKGYTPRVTSEYVAGDTAYPAQSMSDGERVALYLAGRVLDTAPGIIIIDEPEMHFHSRLAIQFWDELEKLRADCRFVYITHDLSFARSRQTNDYIIIRPGQELQLINIRSGIPEDITENILSAASFSIYASRIIFCEGTESSYDQKIYRSWYNSRKDAVIPVGSCKEVIKCATTFQESNLIDGVTAIGLIDRDYWPEVFLNSTSDAITVLSAHEIESLLCLRPVFQAVASHLGRTNADIDALYNEFYSEASSRFNGGLLIKQISERFRLRCSEQVNCSLNSLKVEDNESNVRNNHCAALALENWNISPESIFDEEAAYIKAVLVPPYDDFIKVLPGKVYLGILVDKIGIAKDAYVDLISNALTSKEGESLKPLGDSLRGVLNGILPNG